MQGREARAKAPLEERGPYGFFASLECELLERISFETRTQAKMELFTFIEGFHNAHRRHSALGYLAPVEFERVYWEQALGTLEVA